MENNINELIRIMEFEYNVDIFNKSREKDHVEARAIFSKIMYSYHNIGYTKVGRILKKDHATIYHYIKNFDSWIKYDDRFRNKYFNILNVYSKGLEIKDISETNKIWYDNIVLSTKVEKLENKLSSGLYALLDKVPENKAFIVYERLESIIKMNC
jgi:hypothetical protein